MLNQWQWIITDSDAVPQGELFNASDRTLSIVLNKIDSATFTIRNDHRFADLVHSLEGFLQIYRNGVLMFYGPLTDVSEVVTETEGHITANAASPAWNLTHRWAQIIIPGITIPAGNDRVAAAMALLSLMNTQYYTASLYGGLSFGAASPSFMMDDWRGSGHSLVDPNSTYPRSSASTLGADYNAPAFKSYMEVFTELAAGTGGFDWRFMPVPPTKLSSGSYNPNMAQLWAAPGLGQDRPETVFEYGGKSNVKSFTRVRARDTQANSVRHFISNSYTTTNTPWIQDILSTNLWGAMEDAPQLDITDAGLRNQFVAEHVNVRSQPRHTIEFTPMADYGTGRLPVYGVDYEVGDTVRGRARNQGGVRFDATFRVWGVSFSIDDNGVETPTLTLDSQGS